MNSEALILKIIERARKRGDISPGIADNPKIYLVTREIEALAKHHIREVISTDGKLRWRLVGDALLQTLAKKYKWNTWPVPNRCKIARLAGLSGIDGGKSWEGLGRANRDKIRAFLKARRKNKSVLAAKAAKDDDRSLAGWADIILGKRETKSAPALESVKAKPWGFDKKKKRRKLKKD